MVLSLGNLVSEELVRGVLAPVGHGLWTAILGSVLFSESKGARHPRITGRVVAAYLLLSLLHALWDAMRGIALVLTAIVTGAPPQQIALTGGTLAPPMAPQVDIFLAFQWGGLAIISIVGFLWLRAIWHTAPRTDLIPAIPTL